MSQPPDSFESSISVHIPAHFPSSAASKSKLNLIHLSMTHSHPPLFYSFFLSVIHTHDSLPACHVSHKPFPFPWSDEISLQEVSASSMLMHVSWGPPKSGDRKKEQSYLIWMTEHSHPGNGHSPSARLRPTHKMKMSLSDLHRKDLPFCHLPRTIPFFNLYLQRSMIFLFWPQKIAKDWQKSSSIPLFLPEIPWPSVHPKDGKSLLLRVTHSSEVGLKFLVFPSNYYKLYYLPPALMVSFPGHNRAFLTTS